MSKDNFNEWYKSTFNKLNEEPPAEVWDGISNELDVQEVWHRVDEKLSINTYRGVLRRRIAWAASILLLITAGMLFSYSSDDRAQVAVKSSPVLHSSSFEVKQVSPLNIKESKNATDQSSASEDASTPKENASTKHGKVPSVAALANNNAGRSTNTRIDADASHIEANNALAADPADEPIILASIMHDEIMADASSGELVSSPADLPEVNYVNTYRPVSSGFSVGPLASASNVWLLNRTTIAGLKNTALYQTDFTFGAGYGITAAYDTKGKWGFQADLLLDTRKGQKYHYYDEGAYTSKDIYIHYSQLNMLVRRKKPSRFFHTSLAASRIWTFGTELRLLKELSINVYNPAVSTTNTTITALSRQKQEQDVYSAFDYGVHTGFEYEVQLNKKLLITSGIHLSLGLNNVNRGGSHEPGKFDNTYNAAAGVQLGARYLLHSN